MSNFRRFDSSAASVTDVFSKIKKFAFFINSNKCDYIIYFFFYSNLLSFFYYFTLLLEKV